MIYEKNQMNAADWLLKNRPIKCSGFVDSKTQKEKEHNFLSISFSPYFFLFANSYNENYCSLRLLARPRLRQDLQGFPAHWYPHRGEYGFSFLHHSLEYTVGAPADCTAPPCCRPDSVAKSETSSMQNSFVFHFVGVAGKWGDHSCDNAPMFINETMLWFKNYFEQNPSQKPDFIMVTGDEAIHGSKTRQSQEINIHAAQTVFSMVRQHFRDYVYVSLLLLIDAS